MKDLILEETISCLKTFYENVMDGENGNYSLEFILSIPSPEEINALLFGWLSAKGLWNNAINTTKLFNLAKEELLK